MSRMVRLVASLLLWPVLLAPLSAQAPVAAAAKKMLSVDDYARWRSIDNAQLSPDGKWLVYGYRFSNALPVDAKPVLHIKNLATKQEVEIVDASQATFSPDSRLIVYSVEPPAGGRGTRGGNAGAPNGTAPAPSAPPAARGAAGGGNTTPRRWELRDLATGRVQAWQDIQSANFSPTGTHLVLRRRAAGAATTGADVIVHDLATGRSQFLGSVGETAFNRSGELMAYTVDAAVKDGNGLFVMNLKANRTDVLDNDSLRYSRLSWNDRGTGLAVLKGRAVEKMRERDNRLLVFGDLSATLAGSERDPALLNPATAPGFPKGFVLSERAGLAWSDDGKQVFMSIIPQSAMPDTGKRRSTDSLANVDVWGTKDERIQSAQMVQADADRNRTFRQAFDVAAAKYVTLTDSTMRDIELPVNGHWAVGRDARSYISDYKQAAADFYRVNTLTGERTKMLAGQLTGTHTAGISPDGKAFLYWKGDKWWCYDLEGNASRMLGNGNPVSFVNTEEDHPGVKPPYGVAGYTKDGAGVIVQNRFDLWVLPLDGSGAVRNLTNGAGLRDKIVYRYVRSGPVDSSAVRAARAAREIDLSQPITLSTYGEYTKKAGFSRLVNGQLQSLIYDDASFSNPVRATKAEVYLYTRQTFAEFPDLLIADASLAKPEKVTDANPQQAEFMWGHRILFDYVTPRGDKLQGILALPDDYQPGEKRPMLVTFYEKNSQTMHRYPTPSYLTGMGGMPVEAVSRGYITMLPDVQFHTGSSHTDMLDAVEAATKKVIAMGYVDPKHIGVHGHSYGGEGAAFIGTRSKLFAAIGMGAGVTDLFTDFSQSWGWSYQVSGGSGANGNDYYLFGQGRWGFSPWENPEKYHFESALTHVPEVTTPFLIMHGTADPTVSFSEGMNFYNALRYNGKTATLLAYVDEGHGLRGMANRKDLTIRYFQYFDHYLKGTPAPKWLTDGVPFIVKDTVKGPN